MRRYLKKPLNVRARLLVRDESIKTLEGTMAGKAGRHYYVEGIMDEPYIVERGIFEESHDLAPDIMCVFCGEPCEPDSSYDVDDMHPACQKEFNRRVSNGICAHCGCRPIQHGGGRTMTMCSTCTKESPFLDYARAAAP